MDVAYLKLSENSILNYLVEKLEGFDGFKVLEVGRNTFRIIFLYGCRVGSDLTGSFDLSDSLIQEMYEMSKTRAQYEDVEHTFDYAREYVLKQIASYTKSIAKTAPASHLIFEKQ